MELWLPIENYENYSISTLGNVMNNKTKRILKIAYYSDPEPYAYMSFGIERKKIKIHRLVANAFIHNPNNYLIIDHIDRNVKNNNMDNLRWCTIKQNANNKGTQKNNTSGVKGVYKDKTSWRAVWIENDIRKSKTFKNFDDAVLFRKDKEQTMAY